MGHDHSGLHSSGPRRGLDPRHPRQRHFPDGYPVVEDVLPYGDRHRRLGTPALSLGRFAVGSRRHATRHDPAAPGQPTPVHPLLRHLHRCRDFLQARFRLGDRFRRARRLQVHHLGRRGHRAYLQPRLDNLRLHEGSYPGGRQRRRERIYRPCGWFGLRRRVPHPDGSRACPARPRHPRQVSGHLRRR
jgi:hypothetical protein